MTIASERASSCLPSLPPSLYRGAPRMLRTRAFARVRTSRQHLRRQPRPSSMSRRRRSRARAASGKTREQSPHARRRQPSSSAATRTSRFGPRRPPAGSRRTSCTRSSWTERRSSPQAQSARTAQRVGSTTSWRARPAPQRGSGASRATVARSTSTSARCSTTTTSKPLDVPVRTTSGQVPEPMSRQPTRTSAKRRTTRMIPTPMSISATALRSRTTTRAAAVASDAATGCIHSQAASRRLARTTADWPTDLHRAVRLPHTTLPARAAWRAARRTRYVGSEGPAHRVRDLPRVGRN